MGFENVGDILAALPSARMIGSPAVRRRSVRGITTDTRSLKSSEVFVALIGEHFDGHDFVRDASRRRASAALVSKLWAEGRTEAVGIPLIVVDDTLEAYGRLATVHRRSFAIPVVAVAGSNGKTTTKDLIADLLETKYRVLRTQGNLNNLIGAPATLLRLAAEHEVAVVEIGTNMPGEIARLAHIVQPTHGVITNIGREHLELLGSIEGVAEEEGELFRWLAAHDGTAFVNLDDPHLSRIGQRCPARVTFGSAPDADVHGNVGPADADGAPSVRIADHRGPERRLVDAQLRTPGVHTASNALAAVAVALTLDVPHEELKTVLEGFQPRTYSTGYARLAVVRSPKGVIVLNDTYNANPDSVAVAIETLTAMPIPPGGARVVVLGDMLELGASSVEEHEKVGRLVAENAIDRALFFGPEMTHARRALNDVRPETVSAHFTDKQELAERLLEGIQPGDVVLVKGSRGMRMEEIVAGILREE